MAALQNTIKNNAEELQGYLQSLKNWEKDIKKEDMKLQTHSKEMSKKSNEKDVKCEIEDKKEKKENSKVSNATLSTAERAEKLKEEGNVCYSNGKLEDAVAKYTRGISLNPSNKLLHANRAMAYIKLKKYKAAESDCNRCLQLDSTYIKAYLRRANARTNLGNVSEAIKDYEKVLEFEQWNKDAKRELGKLQQSSKKTISTQPSSKDQCEKGAATKLDLKSHQQTLISEDNISTEEENFKPKNTIIPESNIEEDISNQSKSVRVIPIEKPLNMQSKKRPVTIPITDIDTRENLKLLIEKKSFEGIPLEIKSKENFASKNERKSPLKVNLNLPGQPPSLPDPPKTSYQFSQHWKKLAGYPKLAVSYLKSIPGTFFNGVEVDVDQLVEIVEILNCDEVDSVVGAQLMLSLTSCRGFFINLAFLEENQKEVIIKFLRKVENCGIGKEKFDELQATIRN